MRQLTIRAEQLTKSFTAPDGIINVLDAVSYSFGQGSSYAITGASGTGKSTLLHLLAGLLPPTSGTVYYNETNIALFTSREHERFLRHIGLLFQLFNVYSRIS